MKKALIPSTAFLLAGAMLLGGCSKGGNGYAPGAEKDPSSVSSESSVSEVLSESRSVNSSSGVESSSEQSSDVSAAPVPVEFTDEDKKLQELLRGMEKTEFTIRNWFQVSFPESNDGTPAEEIIFKFSEDNYDHSHIYYQMPPDYSEHGMLIPRTYDDMKELLLNYFSERLTEETMRMVVKGDITKISENVFDTTLDKYVNVFYVTLDKKASDFDYPKFIEAGGAMYRNSGEGGRGIDICEIDIETVKITQKTDDTIEFSFLPYSWITEEKNKEYLADEKRYTEHASTGRLKYERGGWKRDSDKER